MVIRQLSVFLENRAGCLAELTGLLRKSNINLRAINIAEVSDYGVARLIVDHTDDAVELLRGAGHVLSVTPVVSVAVPDCVGGLDMLLAVLSKESINIEYMYSVFGRNDNLAYMIFKVSDPERLNSILEENDIQTTGKRDLSV